MLLSLAITAVALAGAATTAYCVLPWMHHWSYFENGLLGRLAEVFAILFMVAGLLALTVGVYLLASGILTGWFNERLALMVELKLGTPAEDLKQMPFRYQAIDGIVDFLIIAATAVGCFFLGCIPVVGVVGAGVNFYIDWFVMGYDYVDIPMALRGMRRAEKRAFAKRYRSQVLGLGTLVFVMNFVPIIGNVLLTTAAIGAVLMLQRIRETEAKENIAG
jgi:uncharacterized protein involved in cysteine biosynthesis